MPVSYAVQCSLMGLCQRPCYSAISYMRLLRKGAPDECDDLCAGAVGVRAERGVCGALGDILLDSPQYAAYKNLSVTEVKLPGEGETKKRCKP